MTRIVLAVGFLTLVAPITAKADSLAIQVLGAECSTAIELRQFPNAPVTTHSTECGAAQSLDIPTDRGGIQASTSADYLAVTSFSSAYGGVAMDSADSLLTFAPLTGGSAMIGIDYLAGWYSTLFVSLFDVTSQQLIWEQSWAHGTNIGGTDWGFLGPAGSVVVPTDFSADHQYALHMYTDGKSNSDATMASLRVSGLVPVPEPSSLLLLGMGLTGLGVFRRTRKPN